MSFGGNYRWGLLSSGDLKVARRGKKDKGEKKGRERTKRFRGASIEVVVMFTGGRGICEKIYLLLMRKTGRKEKKWGEPGKAVH